MKELEQIYFHNRKSFRDWLEKNFDESPGIWIIFHKKHLQIEGIEYMDALEEALCFGWIDSIIKKIDEDKYVRKFTPRTNHTNWSEVNKRLVIALIKKGLMTEAGLSKIDVYQKTGKVEWDPKAPKTTTKRELEIPDFILEEFGRNEPALKNFNRLARSHKQNYVMWITSAKREETIYKRINEAIALLLKDEKLGLK